MIESLKTYCYKLKLHHESLLPTLYLQVVFHGLPECKSQKKKRKPLGNILSRPLPFIEGETQDPKRKSDSPQITQGFGASHIPSTCEILWEHHYLPVWVMFNIRARSWTWRVFSLGKGNISPSVVRTLHSNRCPVLRREGFLHSKTLPLGFFSLH